MAIKSVHDDIATNKRQRILKKGTLEDRVEALENIIEMILTPSKLSKLSKKEREHFDKVKKAKRENPEDKD